MRSTAFSEQMKCTKEKKERIKLQKKSSRTCGKLFFERALGADTMECALTCALCPSRGLHRTASIVAAPQRQRQKTVLGTLCPEY
jgi:hypothetical protein